MKNLSLLLAFGGLAALPACTINYYGTGPGGHGPRRTGSYNGRDSSQVTVITQSGTGGGVGTYPPPVRTGPGSYPPPRTGGYANNPPIRTGNGNGPVRAGNGPVRANTGNGPVRANTGNGPVRTGGSTNAGPVRAGQSGGYQQPPVYSNGNGGGNGATPAPVLVGTPSPPSKDPLYGTGGIKGPHPTTTPPVRTEPNEPVVSTPVQPAAPADPLYGTGGIKGPHSATTKTEPVLQSSGTGGIRPGRMQDEEPADPLAGTGGIKGPHPVKTDGEEAPIRIVRTSELPNPGPGKGDVKPDGPAFVFSKSPCLGPCPSYTATVWADGRVLYEGQGNVPRIGTFKLHMNPATVTMLLQQAKNAGFTELRDHYASGATDIPATTLTIYQANGRSKTVVVEDNAPDEVNALFGNVAGAIGGVADGGAEGQREEK